MALPVNVMKLNRGPEHILLKRGKAVLTVISNQQNHEYKVLSILPDLQEHWGNYSVYRIAFQAVDNEKNIFLPPTIFFHHLHILSYEEQTSIQNEGGLWCREAGELT